MLLAGGIVSGVLAALLIASAIMKLSHRAAVVHSYARVGVPEDQLNRLAGVLLTGAAGLIAGLAWAPIGAAAAAGVTCYFLIAFGFHVRAHDVRHAGTPLALAVIAAVAFWLRLGAQ